MDDGQDERQQQDTEEQQKREGAWQSKRVAIFRDDRFHSEMVWDREPSLSGYVRITPWMHIEFELLSPEQIARDQLRILESERQAAEAKHQKTISDIEERRALVRVAA